MTDQSYLPLPFAEVAMTGAFWRERLDTVLSRTIPSQHAKLMETGTLESLKLPKPVPPLTIPRIAQRWFAPPNLFFLAPVPILTALVALAQWRFIAARRDAAPFLSTIALFLLGYLGLVISTFPYIVPPSLTIRDAAAAPSSQIFMLIGTLVLLPFVVGYTAFTYWLFHGKVREGAIYH